MEDIKSSLNRAMIKQNWIFGDKVTRIGSPFEWTENEHKSNIVNLQDLLAVGFYFSMFYVKRQTPKEIMIDEYDEVKEHCESELNMAFKHFFPFLPLSSIWKNHIESQAMARTQDYCFIKNFCKDLPKPLSHIDIGPGLGSSATYSIKYFDSIFYALEAIAMSYSVQRNFFRFITPRPGAYLDVIECENYQLTEEDISKELNDKSDYRIKHVPSWQFSLIPQESMDLLTATFVLNELNYAGILWLLAQSSRVLRKNGYFYIRDSFILKPGMHSIEYDKVLTKIGFEKVAELEFENRHDFFGIPRLYRKNSDKSYSFDEMVEMCLGKYASVASGGNMAYNLNTAPAV
jgi:hypothetical protein